MTDYKKLMSVKLITLCNCLCLLALFLCACTELPKDYCGDNNKFNPNTHFCFNDETIAKCGGDDYDPPTQRCVGDTIVKRCHDGSSVPLGSACVVYTLTTTISAGNGTILVNDVASAGITSHDSGTTVNVKAEPAVGYTFTGWSGASSSTNTTVTIVMDGNKELTANFEIKKYKLTTAVPGGGTVSRDPEQEEYDHGTTVIVTAAPASGYAFAGWAGASTSTLRVEVITMDNHKTLAASFEAVPVGYYVLDIDRNPVAGGTVSYNPDTSSYAAGTEVTVTATPNTGYKFVGWSMASTDTSRTVTITMNADRRLIANFERIFMLTINRNPAAGGTVTPTSGLRYDANTLVTITATPADGYRFEKWTMEGGGTVPNASNQNTIVTLTSDMTVTANFYIPSTGTHFNSAITYTFLIDERDRRQYRSVRIGNKTWMAENLNYDVPGNSSDVCYNNDPSNCNTYGRLYDWATVMGFASSCNSSTCASQIQSPNHHGVCPNGWHVPSDEEWTTLTNFAGGSSTAGKKLKSTSSLWIYDATHVGTDDYGFSSLPGGYGYSGGDNSPFVNVGINGNWWSAKWTVGGCQIDYFS